MRNPYIQESMELKEEGKHMEAIRLCERILVNDLKCVEAYEEIGDNYLSMNKYDKAEKALLKALELDKNNANANYLLGFVYSCTCQWKESVDLFEKADEFCSNHPEILRCLGWSMYYDRAKAKGIAVLERALSLTPDDPLILNDLGVLYLKERKWKKSIKLFKKTLQIDPENQKAKECLDVNRFFQKQFSKYES